LRGGERQCRLDTSSVQVIRYLDLVELKGVEPSGTGFKDLTGKPASPLGLLRPAIYPRWPFPFLASDLSFLAG
jgi:hypothetical protein